MRQCLCLLLLLLSLSQALLYRSIDPLPWDPPTVQQTGILSTCLWNRWSNQLDVVGHSWLPWTTMWGMRLDSDTGLFGEAIEYIHIEGTMTKDFEKVKQLSDIDRLTFDHLFCHVMADHNELVWNGTELFGGARQTANRHPIQSLIGRVSYSISPPLSITVDDFVCQPETGITKDYDYACQEAHYTNPAYLSFPPLDEGFKHAKAERISTVSQNGAGWKIPISDGELGVPSPTTNKHVVTTRAPGSPWLTFNVRTTSIDGTTTDAPLYNKTAPSPESVKAQNIYGANWRDLEATALNTQENHHPSAYAFLNYGEFSPSDPEQFWHYAPHTATTFIGDANDVQSVGPGQAPTCSRYLTGGIGPFTSLPSNGYRSFDDDGDWLDLNGYGNRVSSRARYRECCRGNNVWDDILQTGDCPGNVCDPVDSRRTDTPLNKWTDFPQNGNMASRTPFTQHNVKAWCGADPTTYSAADYGNRISCLNGGVHRNINQCRCADDVFNFYVGTFCQEQVPTTQKNFGSASATTCPTDFDLCSGRGTCVDGNVDGVGVICKCSQGWFGNAQFAGIYASQIGYPSLGGTWTLTGPAYAGSSMSLHEYAQLHQCLFWEGEFQPDSWQRDGASLPVPDASGNYVCADNREDGGKLYGGVDCLECPNCSPVGTDVCVDNVPDDSSGGQVCRCKTGYTGTLCEIFMFPPGGACNSRGTLYPTTVTEETALPVFGADNRLDRNINSVGFVTAPDRDPLIGFTTGITPTTRRTLCVCDNGFGGLQGDCETSICPGYDGSDVNTFCGGTDKGTCVTSETDCASVTYTVNEQVADATVKEAACNVSSYGCSRPCTFPIVGGSPADFSTGFVRYASDGREVFEDIEYIYWLMQNCEGLFCAGQQSLEHALCIESAQDSITQCQSAWTSARNDNALCLQNTVDLWVQNTHYWSTACSRATCECSEGWTLDGNGLCTLKTCPSHNGQECNGLTKLSEPGVSVCNRATGVCECWQATPKPNYYTGESSVFRGDSCQSDAASDCQHDMNECFTYGWTISDGTFVSCTPDYQVCSGRGVSASGGGPSEGCYPPSCRDGDNWDTCSDKYERRSCHCQSGYWGDRCQYSECRNAVDLHFSHHAVYECNVVGDEDNRCLFTNGNYQCSCSIGGVTSWQGDKCEEDVTPCVQSSSSTVCSGRGTCVDPQVISKPACFNGAVFSETLVEGLDGLRIRVDPECYTASSGRQCPCNQTAGGICYANARCETASYWGSNDLPPTPAPTPQPVNGAHCVCQGGFNGTYCENRLPCGGSDCNNNGYCDLSSDTCVCDSTWTGTYCNVDTCTSTGGTRINNSTCDCGAGGTYHPSTDPRLQMPDSVDLPAGFTEGCRRLCPTWPSLLDPNVQEECGGPWVHQDGTVIGSRCEVFLSHSNADTNPLSCKCNTLGYNPFTKEYGVFVDTDNGACRTQCEYCATGRTSCITDPYGPYQASGWSCSTLKCAASDSGAFWNGDLQQCVCGATWLLPNANNCSELTTLCDTVKPYSSIPSPNDLLLVRDSDTCNCTEPFVADQLATSPTYRQCLSGCGLNGVADVNSGTCLCTHPYTGSSCTEHLCSPPSVPLPEAQRTSNQSCSCLPQWTGAYCNVSNCDGGQPQSGLVNEGGLLEGCVCYPLWEGQLCTVSKCVSKYGSTDALQNTTQCDCVPGWGGDRCDVNLCGDYEILPVALPENLRVTGYANYTCNCEPVATFNNVTGNCSQSRCGERGRPVVNETANALYCECEEEWEGTLCDTHVCPDERQNSTETFECVCLDEHLFTGGVCGEPRLCTEFLTLQSVVEAGEQVDTIAPGNTVTWTPSSVASVQNAATAASTGLLAAEDMCACSLAGYQTRYVHPYFLGCVRTCSEPIQNSDGTWSWQADFCASDVPAPSPATSSDSLTTQLGAVGGGVVGAAAIGGVVYYFFCRAGTRAALEATEAEFDPLVGYADGHKDSQPYGKAFSVRTLYY